MSKITGVSVLVAAAVAAALLAGATPANASPIEPSPPAPAITTPDTVTVGGGVISGNGYVIVDPGSAESSGSQTFYPTGLVGDDTLIVIPDASGKLPGGLTKVNLPQVVAQLRSQASLPGNLGITLAQSTGTPSRMSPASSPAAQTAARLSPQSAQASKSYSAVSTAWSRSYVGASVIGSNWSALAQYGFNTAAGYSQTAVGLGKGHYRGYNGSTFGVWTTYYNIGSADEWGSTATVPWGQVADNEGFEGKCSVTFTCWGDYWD